MIIHQKLERKQNLLIEERKKIESLNFDEKISNITIKDDNKIKELIRLEKNKLNYIKNESEINISNECKYLHFIKTEFVNLIQQKRKLDLILLNISLFLGATGHLVDNRESLGIIFYII